MIISRLDFHDSAFSPVWWIPLMIVWFLLLLGTAVTIGQLCSSRRDWVYSRWDVQNMLQLVDNTPLVSWTPSKPIPEMPNIPPNLLETITLDRAMFRPETFQQLQSTVRLYHHYAGLVSLWHELWLANDRQGLVSSSELFIDYIQTHMERDADEEEDDFIQHIESWYSNLQSARSGTPTVEQ
ncbi:hypothetical protein EG68_08632 [Paragonimus skrjabini miyazakii]|uniref:Uncharacterized protein n=1 Tax=Paragonimus skrjabini miyazakii TaxID=59628 RepID=A0A8S9YPI7_9TREM|nr:hypothetical protein EG68_08632 [Paragonimus skrjabini miyazakii]